MTLREQNIFHLARTIAKSLQEELTGEERLELETWLQASGKHREMYAKFLDLDMTEKKIAERLALNWKKDCKQFQSLYKKRQGRRIQLRIAQYAAMLILPLIIGMVVWKIVTEKDPVLSTIETNILKSGKAILTTAEGKKIVLDDSLNIPLRECNDILLNVEKGKVLYSLPKDSAASLAKNTEVYNTLTVPRGGDYYLKLSDGTRIWLNAESEIRYPVVFSGKERVLYLEGEAYFDVAHYEDKPFIVKTKNTSVRVLGTQFNLRAYPQEKTVATTLISGSVVFHSDKRGQEIRLVPGEKGEIFSLNGKLSREKVDTYFYTAWKDGRLVFRDTRMEYLLDILARWYDLKIFYENMDAKEIRFTGDLDKSVDFNNILKIIESNERVLFSVNGRTVSVRMK